MFSSEDFDMLGDQFSISLEETTLFPHDDNNLLAPAFSAQPDFTLFNADPVDLKYQNTDLLVNYESENLSNFSSLGQNASFPLFSPLSCVPGTSDAIDQPSIELAPSLALDEVRTKTAQKKKKELEPVRNASVLLELVEGFLTLPKEKVCGGKDNKEPLPLHVVRVHTDKLLHLSGRNLTVRVSLEGYKKLSKERLSIAPITQCNLNVTGAAVDISFDSIIIKHSSHNCGQKLLLNFSLLCDDHVLDYIESARFETITKRGIEKQRAKQRAVRSKLGRETSHQDIHFIDATPSWLTNHRAASNCRQVVQPIFSPTLVGIQQDKSATNAASILYIINMYIKQH
jgi:hypothetical protein